jgi:hypothetical protein
MYFNHFELAAQNRRAAVMGFATSRWLLWRQQVIFGGPV